MSLVTLLIGIVTLISTSLALLSQGSGVVVALASGIVAGSLLSSIFAAIVMLLMWRRLAKEDRGAKMTSGRPSLQR